MTATAVRHHRRLRALTVPVRLRHYEAIETVSWHVQVQLAALTDAVFADPLADANSDDNTADFLYRSDGTDAAGTIAAYDADGAETHLSKTGEDQRAGTAFYAPATVPGGLIRGRTYWLRYRQRPAGTVLWSDWMTEPLYIP